MSTITFQTPANTTNMTYDFDNHRYILTETYVRSLGIDLGLQLDTEASPEPSKVPSIVLNRVSILVYSNIYHYGRAKEDKEYLLACSPDLVTVIQDAMVERLRYMIDSGDLSTRSGALISQGIRVETRDLIPSIMEEMILRSSGLLHRGEYDFIKDETIVY